LTEKNIKHTHLIADKRLNERTDARRPRGACLLRAQFAVAAYFRAPTPSWPESVPTRFGALRVIVVAPGQPALPLTVGDSVAEAGYVIVTAYLDAEHVITDVPGLVTEAASAVRDGAGATHGRIR
jgi:hypothetical protein